MNDDHDDHTGDEGNGEGAGAPSPVMRPASRVAPATPPATEEYGYLTRQEIAEVDDYREEDVAVPEWGGKVRVKSLTGTERDEFEGAIVVEKRDPHRKGKTKTGIEHRRMRAKLVVKAIVHPPGSPQAGQVMFDETDIGWITSKSAAALDRVFAKAQELAGLSDDDVDDLLEGFDQAGTENGGGSTSV